MTDQEINTIAAEISREEKTAYVLADLDLLEGEYIETLMRLADPRSFGPDADEGRRGWPWEA